MSPKLGPGVVLLDSTYPQAATGQFAVFRQGDTAAATLQDVADTSRSDFTMSAKVTELSVDPSTPLNKFFIASTTVYLGGDVLTLAPIQVPVTGSPSLNGWVDGLQAGQWIAVSGSPRTFPAPSDRGHPVAAGPAALDPDTGRTC